MPEKLSVVILAAGRGSRMRNHIPKVLHPLGGWPLIRHVLELAQRLGADRIVTVLAPDMDEVAGAVRAVAKSRIAIQEQPLGTGHALAAARQDVAESGTVLVLYGDTPLLGDATAAALVGALEGRGAAVGVLGMNPPDPSGYGRLRMEGEELLEIVEERHADPALRRSGICNAGAMAFAAEKLPALLDSLPLRPEKNEYYLTDAVRLARERGWRCTAITGPAQDGLGVNSQRQLAAAEAVFQERRRDAFLDAGVVMQAPETVYFAADTVIEPGAMIEPHVIIGCGVRIGRAAVIRSFCHLEGVEVGEGAVIGPFARLRPGTTLGRAARVGNFVEVKNAQLGEGAKANHLTYLGDATVAAAVNIGAGTITCNYDGFNKHRTEIGEGAFIGSNTALVAPVVIGPGAIVGAGSTITRDVPENALSVARAVQENKPDRAGRIRAAKSRKG